MQNKFFITLCVLCLSTLVSCSQDDIKTEDKETEAPVENVVEEKPEQHRYGGWYCPDNLGGFPAVDINDWDDVPVVNGRMATQEETQNGTSLINVDMEKYPDAKPLDMQMPKLARYYCRSSRKEELIIVIQALNVQNDSVVGFRYLNGGNGSSYLDEVRFLSDDEIKNISSSQFVTLELEIDATKTEVWDVMTNDKFDLNLHSIFDPENTLGAEWNESSEVNFKYLDQGIITSAYAGELYGNQYIQIDSERDEHQLVEKFFLSEDEETKKAYLQIVCGPYGDDFNEQKVILENWSQKVKELSESL